MKSYKIKIGNEIKERYYIDAFTDYPFVELGDIPHQKAPIRAVKVIAYDGDKYVQILLPSNTFSEVKRCYCYIEPKRLENATAISSDELKMLPRSIFNEDLQD
jgi:hypothetical protein